MKTTTAVVAGFLSGALFSEIVVALFDAGSSALIGLVPLVGGWAVTTPLLLKRANTTNTVVRRAFLVGAAEWLVMMAVVLFVGVRSAVGKIFLLGIV